MKLIFGFSGNPPHFGHIDVIQQALEQLPLLPLEVIIVPVRRHPFGKKTNDPELILKMARAFEEDVRDICNVQASMIDIEGMLMDLFKLDTVYSADVLQQVKRWGDINEKIMMVFGPDNEKEFANFKHVDYLRDNADIFFAKARKGVRSTHIRQAIMERTTLKNGDDPYEHIPKHTRSVVQFYRDKLFPQEQVA